MKKVNLIHLGIGNVGRELFRQIFAQRENIVSNFNTYLNYCAAFNSKGGMFNPKGLTIKQMVNFHSDLRCDSKTAVEKIPLPFILIDTTSSDDTYPLLEKTLRRGGFVVLSNKRPLASSFTQFRKLHGYADKLFYETTVGAGLPVISTIKTLLATGDEIVEISGCFSGTLGFICSSLEGGNAFSDSVVRAKNSGFTELDPREDLSGRDVARKVLILARMIGMKTEQNGVKVQKLYPKKFDEFTVEKFMQKIKELDKDYKKKFQTAKKKGKTFRFVAKVLKKNCSVNLMEVEKDSDLGNLKGPDNMIILKTKRYFTRPMVIKGPGAGAEVTASGVFADILEARKRII